MPNSIAASPEIRHHHARIYAALQLHGGEARGGRPSGGARGNPQKDPCPSTSVVFFWGAYKNNRDFLVALYVDRRVNLDERASAWLQAG